MITFTYKVIDFYFSDTKFPFVLFNCKVLDDDLLMICSLGIIVWTYDSIDGIKMKSYWNVNDQDELWVHYNSKKPINKNLYVSKRSDILKTPNISLMIKLNDRYSIKTNNGIIWPFKELIKSYLKDENLFKLYAKEFLNGLEYYDDEIRMRILDKCLENFNHNPLLNVGFLYLIFGNMENIPRTNNKLSYLEKVLSTMPIFLDPSSTQYTQLTKSQNIDLSMSFYSRLESSFANERKIEHLHYFLVRRQYSSQVNLMSPMGKLWKYPKSNNLRPSSNHFIDDVLKKEFVDFFKRIVIQALINFKWHIFGKYYY